MAKNIFCTLADEICTHSEPILSLDKNIYFMLADEICTLSEAILSLYKNLYFTLADEICTLSEANGILYKNLLPVHFFSMLTVEAFYSKKVWYVIFDTAY